MGKTAVDGRRLRERREELDLSHRELAAIVGVSHETVRQWELGRAEPRVSVAIAVAKALRLSLVDLCPGVAAA